MKRMTIAILSAALGVAAVSCKKSADGQDPVGGGRLTATAESHVGDGKTHLDGSAVKWNNGDRITVFAKTTSSGEVATFTAEAPSGSQADFETEGAFSFEISSADDGYTAVYPALQGAATSSISVSDGYSVVAGGVTLAPEQTYDATGFASGANPMAGYSTDRLRIGFKNLCGVLCVVLKGTGESSVKTIQISSNDDDEALWGTGDVKVKRDGTERPTIENLTAGSGDQGKITLKCYNDANLNGVALSPDGTKFYFVVPAGTLKNGFTVKAFDQHDHVMFKKSAPGLHAEGQTEEGMLASYIFTMTEQSLGTDLSDGGAESANCYMAKPDGKAYRFYAKKRGNGVVVENTGITSGEITETIGSVEVLWETVNTDAAPSVGAIVSDVKLKSDYIEFKTGTQKGNASIAVRNSESPYDILWSWHIWVTDYDPTGTASGILMDRNLGALSSDASSGNASYGLMYQWGRKDPFMGSSVRYSSEVPNTSYMACTPSDAFLTPVMGTTIKDAILAPTTFMTEASANTHDWLLTQNDKLWNSSTDKKTMYDPCPAGWRVPFGGNSDKNPWHPGDNSGNTGHSFTNNTVSLGGYIWSWVNSGTNNGGYATLNGHSTGSVVSQFPASGGRSSSNGALSNVGSCGYYWSATPNGNVAYALSFSSSYVNPSSNYRANGFCVRPVQESSSASK